MSNYSLTFGTPAFLPFAHKHRTRCAQSRARKSGGKSKDKSDWSLYAHYCLIYTLYNNSHHTHTPRHATTTTRVYIPVARLQPRSPSSITSPTKCTHTHTHQSKCDLTRKPTFLEFIRGWSPKCVSCCDVMWLCR